MGGQTDENPDEQDNSKHPVIPIKRGRSPTVEWLDNAKILVVEQLKNRGLAYVDRALSSTDNKKELGMARVDRLFTEDTRTRRYQRVFELDARNSNHVVTQEPHTPGR
jgi:hypothetical protein